MKKTTSRLSEKQRYFEVPRPAQALVNFLNNPEFGDHSIEEFVADAHVVFQYLEKYKSFDEWVAGRKKEKPPEEFYEVRARLNEKLAQYAFVPRIDTDEFYDGNPIFWMANANDYDKPHLVMPLQCFLQVIDQGAILKIRRCKECPKWYFARMAEQRFCSDKCRRKHFSHSEDFKEYRRKKAREYYKLHRYKNIK
jgi:hypothetical protein